MTTYAQPYPNPYVQQQQQQQQRSTYPPVQPPPPWVRPPYSGAPPIPAGVSVNPQQWQAGFWQINPAYKHSAGSQPQQQQQQPQQHVPWIPSHHWTNQQSQRHSQQSQASAQASQQASFNPYKRMPKAPSAEYLATELSSNPLGLENMVPVSVEEYYRQGHQTPWIWKPNTLEDDDSPTSSQSQRHPTDPTLNSSAAQSRRHSEGEVNREPESFTTKRELQPTFSSKIVRTPEHYRNDSTHTPSPKRSTSYSSMGSLDSQLSSRMSQMSMNSSNGTSPTPLSRHSSMPLTSSTSFTSMYSSSPTRAEFPSAPMLTDQLSDEPDSMLSPLIIAKTPMLPASNNLRTLRNHPNPLLATQSLDTIPEGASSYKGMRVTPNPPPRTPQQQGGDNHYPHQPSNLQHSQTMPNPPKSQFVYPSNPPQMVLPPKNPDQEKENESRERVDRIDRDQREREREWERIGSRHTTYVDPHVTSTGTPSPRSRVQSRSSSRPSSRPSSTHASPVRHATNITPPTYPTSPPSAHNTSYVASPSNPSRSANPLPTPPQLVQRQPILPVQRTPPPTWREKLRRGFWNRRGDFLTADGYIVYAPSDKAYPPELMSYPGEDVGYQDHNLQFTAYVARPELPQSLPKHGQPPECPYEAFVVYEYK